MIHIARGSENLGIWPEAEILSYMRQGNIVGSDHYWREGMGEWRSCSELFSLQSPPSPPPPLAPAPVPRVPFATERRPVASAAPMDEKPLIERSPSQWVNAKFYTFAGLLCFLVVPIPFCIFAAVGRWLSTRSMKYTITSQRVGFKCGIFSKVFQQIELFRVEDLIVETSFLEGIFKLGTVLVITGDKTRPQISLRGIREPEKVCETLRTYVVLCRQANGVIAIENLR